MQTVGTDGSMQPHMPQMWGGVPAQQEPMGGGMQQVDNNRFRGPAQHNYQWDGRAGQQEPQIRPNMGGMMPNSLNFAAAPFVPQSQRQPQRMFEEAPFSSQLSADAKPFERHGFHFSPDAKPFEIPSVAKRDEKKEKKKIQEKPR